MTQNSSNKKPSSNEGNTNLFLKTLIPLSILFLIGTVIAIIVIFKPNNDQQSSAITSNELSDSENKPLQSTIDNNTTTQASQNTSKSFITGLESLPNSLQGTDVDGEIIIDEQKQLVVTEGLRRLFDYFLTTQGEEDIATIIQRVESYIRHHTPEPASTQAIDIFRQYLGYLNGITELENSYSNFQLEATRNGEIDLNLIAQRKQDLTQLRKKFFDDATISAFFDAEDEYDDYSIAMMQIDTNDTMDTASKEAAKQDYVSRMPQNTIKTNLEQQANLKELIERTDALKAQGANEAELFRLRAELFGAPAAARLAQVDAEDADFDSRFKQYQAAKQRLLQPGLSDSKTQLQINQLEQQLFNEAERKRLKGYGELLELEKQK